MMKQIYVLADHCIRAKSAMSLRSLNKNTRLSSRYEYRSKHPLADQALKILKVPSEATRHAFIDHGNRVMRV